MSTQSATPEPDLDTIKKMVEIDKMQMEIAKLFAETVKTNRENRWSPIVYATGAFAAGAGFLAAIVGAAKLFMH